MDNWLPLVVAILTVLFRSTLGYVVAKLSTMIKTTISGNILWSTDNSIVGLTKQFSEKDNFIYWVNFVNKIRFYKKDLPVSTFKSFMELKNLEDPYNGWHPSPESHLSWANELYRYISINNLI